MLEPSKTIFTNTFKQEDKIKPILDIFHMSARDLFDYQRQEYIDNCLIPTVLAFDLPVEVIQRSEYRFIIKLDEKTCISCILPDYGQVPVSYFDGGRYAIERDRQLFNGIDTNMHPIEGPEYDTISKIPYKINRTTERGFGVDFKVCSLDKEGTISPYNFDLSKKVGDNPGEGPNRIFNSEAFYQEITRVIRIMNQ